MHLVSVCFISVATSLLLLKERQSNATTGISGGKKIIKKKVFDKRLLSILIRGVHGGEEPCL